MVLKLGHFGKIRYTWAASKCGAGKELGRVLDRLCEKSKRATQSQGGEEHLKYYKRRKGNGIDRYFLLKHFVERKVEGTGKRGRRRKQLLNNLMETKRYWKCKKKNQRPSCGKFVLEKTMDLS